MRDLGFGSRTERDKYHAGGVATTTTAPCSNVGPGSYDICERNQHEAKGTAPFLSRSERLKHVNEAGKSANPSPAAYRVPSSFDHMAKKAEKSNVFRSGTSRFKANSPEAEDTPGPGSYLEIPTLAKKGNKETGAAQMARSHAQQCWVRTPSAPSIPGRESSYGYADAGNGVLIQQKLAEPGYTGTAGDTPGPSDYRPNYAPVLPKTLGCVDIGKGPERLASMHHSGSENSLAPPSPEYDIYNSDRVPFSGAMDENAPFVGGTARDGTLKVRHRRQPPNSSAFKSATGRSSLSTSAPGANVPGPGAYVLPSTLEAAKSPAKIEQSFLSTARRFSRGSKVNPQTVPGPGSYNIDYTHGSRRIRYRRRPNSANGAVGFESSSHRFNSERQESSAGPAAYDIPGMAQLLQRQTDRAKQIQKAKRAANEKLKSRAKSGGSRHEMSSQSFNLLRQESAHIDLRLACGLEKGHRAKGSKVSHASAKKPTSAFASETKRFDELSNGSAKGPAPGEYHRDAGWDVKGAVQMFPTKKDRFAYMMKSASSSESVGPGSYEISQPRGWKGGQRETMGAASERFARSSTSVGSLSPGPGAYSPELAYGNLLKPTHNIAIAELTRVIS